MHGREVVERLGEMHSLQSGELRDDHASHRGAAMNWKHDLDVAPAGEPPDRVADVAHGFALTLSAVQREEDPSRSGGRHRLPQEAYTLDRPEQGVDHRVPGHQHAVLGYALCAQVVRVPPGRTEVNVRQPRDEPAVRFFGERGSLVARAKAGLDVPHGHARVEGRQRSAERR